VKGQRKKLMAIKLRIIKLISPDGTVSVLLTNLFDTIPTAPNPSHQERGIDKIV
jgi:hypothetical protein